jgi:tetratricopeptide (TPR) repeat protein
VQYRRAAEIHATERKDHAAAAALLEKASALKPDDRDLMLALCAELTASGRGKDAIAVLNRVVESYGGRRSKELADIHHRIASAHLAENDHNAALNELGTLSLRMAENGTDDKDEHLKRAGNAFRSLLLQRLDTDSPVSKADVFYSLALVSQAEGDKKKAIQMAERAIANDKSLDKAKSLLAELKN